MAINSDRVEIMRRLNERADENIRKWGQKHDDEQSFEHFAEIIGKFLLGAERNEKDRSRLLIHAGATIINALEREARRQRKAMTANSKDPTNEA